MGLFSIFKKKISDGCAEPQEIECEKGLLETFLNKLYNQSLIILINGKRGSGKTAFGFYLLELLSQKTKRRCYILGYKKISLPWFVKKIDEIEEINNNSILLVDEGSLAFSARESMKKGHVELTKIMAIARHKNLTLIVITQSSALVDLNIIRLTDTLIFKEPSLLQTKFERKAIKEMYEKVIPFFEDKKAKADKCFIWDDEFQGLISFQLPTFWSSKISTSFKKS